MYDCGILFYVLVCLLGKKQRRRRVSSVCYGNETKFIK